MSTLAGRTNLAECTNLSKKVNLNVWLSMKIEKGPGFNNIKLL